MVFSFEDYKQYLSSLVTGENNWGMLSKLAEAGQCQKSYLSRVIHKEIHLTTEQAFRLSRFIHHDPSEQEYFCLLVEYARSGDADHRKYVRGKMIEAKRNFEKQTKEANKKISPQNLSMSYYYTRLDWMLIHYLTTIAQYQSLEKICQLTLKTKPEVEFILNELLRLNLVEKKGAKWIYQSGDEHLNAQHPMLPIFHRLLRERAVRDLDEGHQLGLHFSSVQTISAEDADKIKGVILKAIENYHKISRPSQPEELVILNIDYFRPFDRR